MLEKLFKLREHNTNTKTEIIAGLTTFAAMSYILVVNPSILSKTGMDFQSLITVTALAAAIGTLIMAFLTNYPIALAPGMGLNAYFTFTVCLGSDIPWQGALGMVFWNGVTFLLLTVTGLRTLIAESIPTALKIGVQCGIGLFIAFIGLENGGIIINHDATLVTIGHLSEPAAMLVIAGIILTAALVVRKVLGAIIISILAITVIGLIIPAGDGFVTQHPESFVSMPASISESFFAVDIMYPIRHFATAWPVIFAMLFVDMFDTIGTLIGVSRQAGLVDKTGRLPKMGNALTADACATIVGSFLGTSTTTSYIESAAGAQAGGRTGLTAVTVAACFLLALIFTPIITIIPPQATGPALIMVGMFMMQGISQLDFKDITQLAPAVLTMLIMPLAFSISEGIAIGFIVYVGVMALAGRHKEISPLLYILAAIFMARYAFGL